MFLSVLNALVFEEFFIRYRLLNFRSPSLFVFCLRNNIEKVSF